MSKPRIWWWRGAWRCSARGHDVIGFGKSPSAAYAMWAVETDHQEVTA